VTTASRKILVPLATLVAAGAIAVGSGATFTSHSGNTISAVTSGTLKHTNSKADSAIFDLTNIKPGDTLNGNLVITNNGSLDAAFSLTEVSSSNGFSGSYLTLSITDVTTGASIYAGTFGDLDNGVKKSLGVIAAGQAHDFRFTVKLAQDAPDSQQGKTATAVYDWDSVQLDGQITDQ
jgi:spore coat-associated protein N